MVGITGELLMTVKMDNDPHHLLARISDLKMENLRHQLNTDSAKLVFWINAYNAYYQIIRRQQLVDKSDIYKSKVINIAGRKFSLDDIEHGILRRHVFKFSLGYIRNPFVDKLIKQLAVSVTDFRIHFALNCGAKSCPPIAYYKLTSIDHQLQMATEAFLEQETIIDHSNQSIMVTALFQWFRADFGGMKGIKDILSNYLDVDASRYAINYAPYSWDDHLENFVD